MATSLAIGYLATPAGNPVRSHAPARSAHVSEHDSITSRPPIPRAVVTWPDPDDACVSMRRRSSLDGVLIGVLAALLSVLAGAVAWQFDRPAAAWVAHDQSPPPLALLGKIPVVEMRVLGLQPLATPASAVAASSAEKPATSEN
jgi:hypothetical protein